MAAPAESRASSPPDETLSLLRPLSRNAVGTLCIFAVAGSLALGWCLMDSWNHDVVSDLFSFALDDMKAQHFNAPFLLAFLQFVAMGCFFSMLYFFLVPTANTDLVELWHAGGTWTWVVLVLTHAFSLFCLQSLVLPTHPMSLGLFAAAQSLEIPIVAVIRAQVFDTKPRKRDLAAPVLMFAAACALFYSYSRLSQCLCIWTGFGVQLTGVPFACVFVLVLATPAANFVAQESLMVHLRVQPLLVLAIMNLGACLVCLPLLPLAHLAGWEDISSAWQMIEASPQVYMLIVWLCAQMAATSGFASALIYTVNSFWAVALRSLRVVVWWLRVLLIFYFTSGAALLSTSLPNESFWSFMMFCGLCLMVAAICAETHPEDTIAASLPAASHKLPPRVDTSRQPALAALPPPASEGGRWV